jgi:hypothetical protein
VPAGHAYCMINSERIPRISPLPYRGKRLRALPRYLRPWPGYPALNAYGGGAPKGAPAKGRWDQNFESVAMKLLPTVPMPVRLSKPGAVVRVTLRVSQLPVPSQ